MIKNHNLLGNSLDQILADYLEAVNSGRPLDRGELLARYPDLAAALEAFFADEDRFLRAAGPVKPVFRGNPAGAPQAALAETITYTPGPAEDIRS